MLRTLVGAMGEEKTDSSWLGAFAKDFHKRFLELLSYQFRSFPAVTSLTIDQSAAHGEKLDENKPLTALKKEELDKAFSPFDLKRLDKYADQMIDYHLILDLLPTIATLYFSGRLKSGVSLSRVQQAILLAVGLQRKSVEDMERELELASSQVLGLFVKIMRKFSGYFRSLVEGAVSESMPDAPELADENGAHEKMDEPRRVLVKQSLDEELAEAGAEIDHEEKERMRAMIDALPLERYEIANGGKVEWQDAERQVASGKSSTVSVKTKRPDEGKRKAGGAFAEAVKEADEARERRKGKKAKR
jgi:N-acetyltransferase 10